MENIVAYDNADIVNVKDVKTIYVVNGSVDGTFILLKMKDGSLKKLAWNGLRKEEYNTVYNGVMFDESKLKTFNSPSFDRKDERNRKLFKYKVYRRYNNPSETIVNAIVSTIDEKYRIYTSRVPIKQVLADLDEITA